MLASLFEFSFLCIVALANLCLGIALASHLGWSPRSAAFFQLDQTVPTNNFGARDCEREATDGEEPAGVERTSDDAEDASEPAE